MNANQEYTIIGGAGGSDQTTTMPTPSAENLGTIVQYVGDTNQYYTNGYFYKVVSNGEVPPTYSREQVDTQPASSGEEHAFITQADYDNLTPAQKAEKVYMITGEGETPTPGGGTAVESGNMLFKGITSASDNDTAFISPTTSSIYMYNNAGIKVLVYSPSISTAKSAVVGGKLYAQNAISHDRVIVEVEPTTGVAETIYTYQNNSYNNYAVKFADYMYTRSGGPQDSDTVYEKVDYEGNVTASDATEFNSIPSGIYYKGLFYSQDNNDYVAVDSTGTEVKRYSNVGTINGIYDDKLYRNVGDVAYAIATI